ncbi:MAG: DegT/DnrJ/EryC1/StrS family aminotransferase, partial [Desulfuromonadales bacterium]|nr:DegT/DnrJ/EryC1/StrS family aminotransferase [Desulfuromonadales bacterium]
LGRGKAFSTVEGGILLTDNREIAAAIEEELSELKPYNFFELVTLVLTALALKLLTSPALFWLPKSLPFLQIGATHFDPDFAIRTFSKFQAGLTFSWLERLERFRTQRRFNAEKWAMQKTNNTVKPYLTTESLPDLIRFPIECADESVRRELLHESERYGLGLAAVYPDTIAGITELKKTFAGQQFPVAQQLVHRLATLPVHPLVANYDRQRIARLLGRDKIVSKVTAAEPIKRAG